MNTCTSAHLDGGECGHDGRTAEAVGDEAEVGEMPLDLRVEDDLRPRVTQRRPVLVQQVHQLLGDLPVKEGSGQVLVQGVSTLW